MKWKQYLLTEYTIRISQKVSPSVAVKSCYIWLDEIPKYYISSNLWGHFLPSLQRAYTRHNLNPT